LRSPQCYRFQRCCARGRAHSGVGQHALTSAATHITNLFSHDWISGGGIATPIPESRAEMIAGWQKPGRCACLQGWFGSK
jgi:hypothetical protein